MGQRYGRAASKKNCHKATFRWCQCAEIEMKGELQSWMQHFQKWGLFGTVSVRYGEERNVMLELEYEPQEPWIPTSDIKMKCTSAICPSEFNATNNNSCYFFSHDAETWTGALISCQMLEGYLVEIETEEEYKFLHDKCASLQAAAGGSRWVALSDKRKVNIWEWATSHTIYNSLVAFNMWATGEPDHYAHNKDESCVLLDKFDGDGKHHDYELADVFCERREKYICEYKKPELMLPMIGK